VNNAKQRATIHSLPAIVGLLFWLTVLVLIAVHVRVARPDIRTLNQECSDEASAFRSEADNLATGYKVVGNTSRYDRQRRQYLVEMTSKRPAGYQPLSKSSIRAMGPLLLRAIGFQSAFPPASG
jgi:hypothetical protein